MIATTKGKHWTMPKGHQKGEKNSSYGKHWFHNDKGEIIMAKECPIGFKKGKIEKVVKEKTFKNCSHPKKIKCIEKNLIFESIQ
jgi:hypothetical protein